MPINIYKKSQMRHGKEPTYAYFTMFVKYFFIPGMKFEIFYVQIPLFDVL